MQIQVKLGEPLWRSVGRRRLALDWPGAAHVTLEDVLARLAADYPDFAKAYAGQGLRKAYPYQLFVDASRFGAPSGGNITTDRPPGENGPCLLDGQTLFILLPAIGGQQEPTE